MNGKYFTGYRKKPMADQRLELLARIAESAENPLSLTGLLADSRPLFEAPLQEVLRAWMAGCQRRGMPAVQGVYVGASNGDEPAYFELAQGFFAALGIHDAWHWLPDAGRALPSPSHPCLIVLAGGSVLQGWLALNTEPWQSWLRCYEAGPRAVLGVSAGAVQLTGGLDDNGRQWRGLGMHELTLSVHDETTEWASAQWLLSRGAERLLCLPFGSAVCLCGGSTWAVSGAPFWME